MERKRKEQPSPILAMASETVSNLPIVDLTKENLKPNTTSWNQACADVRGALEEHGCFLALYDQVPSELNKEVFDLLKDLFDLPIETKVQNSSDIAFFGYIGQLPNAPLHESMGIPDATTVEGVERFSNLMWPSGNKRFWYAFLPLKTPEELVDQLHPLQFKPLDHLGLVKYYLTGKVDMLGSTAKAYCGITVSKLGNCRLYSSMCVAIAYEICQNSSNLILKNI